MFRCLSRFQADDIILVFAYLLGKCLLLGSNNGTKHLMAIGTTTVISFIILFLPFLTSFLTHFITPIQRIVPFARGLFEDKVANFWCASSVFFKWKKYFPTQHIPKLATALTAIGFIPSMYALLDPSIKAFGTLEITSVIVPSQLRSTPSIVVEKVKPAASCPAPTFVLFTHALLQCSFAFFLFSFQVHEKMILVPSLPVMLLMVSSALGVDGDWEWGMLVENIVCFSMWPLLKQDGQAVQYVIHVIMIHSLIFGTPSNSLHT